MDIETFKVQNLSRFVKDFKIVPLETNEEYLIGQIDKIEIVNDTIYILDRLRAKTLFLYSIDGKYLSKISRIGKGPGEFMEPMAFDFDPVKHKIMIYDRMSFKINIYNTKTKYLKNIKLNERITNFIFHHNYYYLYTNPLEAIDDNKVIHKINSRGHYIWSALDSKIFLERRSLRNLKGGNFYKYNDEVIFWMDVHPVIYSIKNKTISPKFILNTVKHRINENIANGSLREILKSDMLHTIQEYSENSIYSLFNFMIGRRRFYVIYDKNSKTMNYYNFLKDDLSYLNPNYFKILDDNRMLGIVSSNDMMRSNKDLVKELNINENNNPILVLYDFNK